ncbi:MAG: class I SAM-dependent methyltransferase [Acidobacteria bacterium]|nr:class I SAM-dependent methyltransferase [Acidobacteriota bacterium]
MKEAQAFSVKRAEVEFHNFASLGEPERAMAVYAEENRRRGGIIRNHGGFIGAMSPFLEIGSNVGHTSYMLANEFGADGFALDISADALRYGAALEERWGLARAPVKVAGDALNLPFRDGSLRLVCAFQMLSQFMDVEAVFLEVKRVLAPGGVFLFAEEPLKRLLSLRLYRCPYYDTMKPWERTLYDSGLLGYLVRDVIGAHQEESFGIRQNHTMGLRDWHGLIRKHFAAHEYEICVPERGWGERVVKRAAQRADRHGSEWIAARLLGGTLAGTLACPACGYQAANDGGVYNLLPSAERRELYPGDREDLIDFSQPGHERRLLEGWYEAEGVFGNRYRWIAARATARLARVRPGAQRLRLRGHAHEQAFTYKQPVTIEARANGARIGQWTLDRSGLFLVEADLPDAPEYTIEILAGPTWQVPTDDRVFSVNISMLRLVPRD